MSVSAPRPDPLELDQVFLEARFPRRVAFLDHLGEIADEFEGSYPDGDVAPLELRFRDEGSGAELVIAANRVWLRKRGESSATEAIEELESAIGVLTKVLGGPSIEFVGARQFLLLPVSDVSAATALFRRAFYDYREPPFTAFGEDPLEAQASVSYRLERGVSRVVGSAIYRGEALDSETGPHPGALLLDIDQTDDQGMDVWEVRAAAMALLTEGRGRAVDFLARLNPPAESTDTGEG